ncbi:hypothetical protein P22_1155 [Propionispora sp. 2/2-37]|uniref:FkbM family methyltransferase n=1 Tax=Propionispora sp. 2/2-37 TaxID=1677858 RepID=UPI0006BB7199|nr:FkbM family methyltransferase [Propionispora sp. 2/2-37]CUH95086.1 hypothetical protein P22_1155 [Propionispora sp. 2/2-37]
MAFISYAQNLEDVMLWRVFSGLEKGFYIDVGANDPVIDSVTKAFYDRGWRGVNIEPLQSYYQRLCQERTRDINLQVAAGNYTGMVAFYEIPDTGLSTMNYDIAEQHRLHGWEIKETKVPVMTLLEICQNYVRETIHFLKIDVEGTEKQVLLGMDFQQYRPWVIVIEATIPLGKQQKHSEWEDILLRHGYQYTYFDGLNRFYIAQEKGDCLSHFSSPPNPFDEYLRYSEFCLKERIDHIYVRRPWITAPLFSTELPQQEQRQILKKHLQGALADANTC